MILLALDSSTPSSVAAVLRADGRVVEARDDPPPGSRGEHAARLLALAEDAMAGAETAWDDLDRIAVGAGPGGFTGLRIGIATARALAQARGLPLVPVGSLDALAAGADAAGDEVVAAVIDARRGEVFAAAFARGEPLLEPAALAPDDLASRLAALDRPVRAVGDGAVRFRQELARAGISVPADDSSVHRIGADALCRLGAARAPAERDALLPDYRREPDAKPPQR
ncbi:MAG TPA: tRNA (adenosine(37)-N6)-threonylcarbamoyltransferase complex dimerization subunit type 1 TsaB [Solirubrobacteraceae bacterium]|nr:tRNA (adenosine(37)-N6)-threonylcarbamoyltransferase complex dimerization subunit type 1 TsaB [Solirubrobacteraceae bacterium]